jgi:hypothetical protein
VGSNKVCGFVCAIMMVAFVQIGVVCGDDEVVTTPSVAVQAKRTYDDSIRVADKENLRRLWVPLWRLMI